MESLAWVGEQRGCFWIKLWGLALTPRFVFEFNCCWELEGRGDALWEEKLQRVECKAMVARVAGMVELGEREREREERMWVPF